jgi:hypothetical protein
MPSACLKKLCIAMSRQDCVLGLHGRIGKRGAPYMEGKGKVLVPGKQDLVWAKTFSILS